MGKKLRFSSVVNGITSLLHVYATLQLSSGQNTTGIKPVNDTENGSNNASVTANSTFSDIDFETLSMLGINQELAEEFRLNLLKAIETLKEQEANPDGSRQNEFGNPQGGEGGEGQGGGQEEEEAESEEMVPTTQGPGAFGVLSGIFGIFSGLGTLNPSRIIQSTVNFFPPTRRNQAQMVVDSLIGYKPNTENRTFRPRTERPTTVPTLLPNMTLSETNGTMKLNSTAGGDLEVSNSTLDSNGTMSLLAKDVESNNDVLRTRETTTFGFINLSDLLNMTSTAVPPTDEDDEIDLEKKNSTASDIIGGIAPITSYKLIKPKPVSTTLALTNETLVESETTSTTDTTSTSMKVEDDDESKKGVVVVAVQ